MQQPGKKRMVLALAVIVGLGTGANAQSQEKVYSALMLSFARGIQWPGGKENGDFVIGVLEYPPLAAELGVSTNAVRIGAKKVSIQEFSHADEVGKCQMLFIPAYKARQLEAVLAKLGNNPTLIITNKMDLAKKGSGVNFVLVDGKLKYEINLKSIERRGMKIPANVKNMGIIVE